MICAVFYQRILESDIAAVGTAFNVFSYDAVKVRDANPSPTRMIEHVLRYSIRFLDKLIVNFKIDSDFHQFLWIT